MAGSLAFFFSQIREFLYYSFPNIDRVLLKLPLLVCTHTTILLQVRHTVSNLQFQGHTIPKNIELSVLLSCYSLSPCSSSVVIKQIQVHSSCEKLTPVSLTTKFLSLKTTTLSGSVLMQKTKEAF